MLCRRAHDWISLALDGMLPPDRTVALTEHLAKCGACRAYREEARLGQRLLAATAPRLSDNFEWRLQIKLNRTLQEAAREVTSPWAAHDGGWRRCWLQGAAVAAVGGLAIVAAVSALLLPGRSPLPVASRSGTAARLVATASPQAAARETGAAPATTVATVTSTAGDASRTSFMAGGFGLAPEAGGLGHDVDLRFTPGYGTSRGGSVWTGGRVQDLRTITHLREQNLRLRDQLAQAQREADLLRARLAGGVSAQPGDSVPAPRR